MTQPCLHLSRGATYTHTHTPHTHMRLIWPWRGPHNNTHSHICADATTHPPILRFHAYSHTHTHACMHECSHAMHTSTRTIHTHVQPFTYSRLRIHVCIYAPTIAFLQTHMGSVFTHTCTHARTHTRIVRTRSYPHTQTHMHAYTHDHVHNGSIQGP